MIRFTTYKTGPCRVWRFTPQCALSVLTTFLLLLLLLLVYHHNTTTPPYSRSHEGHAENRQQKHNEWEYLTTTQPIPLGSWRLRKRLRDQKSWLTTTRNDNSIFTTQHPMVTTKYFTYIEDFLANWDKYPLSEDVTGRVKNVRDAAIKLKNRQLFTQILTTKQRNVVYDLLSSFDALARKEGIRYFAYGGTLLGSFRHHDMVPYDDDVDVIIHYQDRDKLKKAVKRKSMTFSLSTLSPDHYKLHNKYGEFTNLYHDWTYPYIDISFYRLNRTHLRDLARTYGKWWEYRIDDIFPLHERPLGPLMIPAPKDTYKYLTQTYDLSKCSESYYSHELEMVVRCRMVSTNCEKLPYSFVHRSVPSTGSGVNESLILNGQTLHWKIVEEPDYQANIRNPYSLALNPP